MQILLLFLALPLFSTEPFVVPSPGWSPAVSPTQRLETPDQGSGSKWSHTPQQIGAGVFGGIVGGAGGTVLGFGIGAAIGMATVGDGSCSEDAIICIPAWFGPAAIGAVSGAGILGVLGTAWAVQRAAPLEYPSASLAPAAAGSVAGLAFGVVAIAATREMGWGVRSGLATLALSSSLGAVLLDRGCALHPSLTLAPWTPDGRAGAVAVAEF